MLNNKGRIPCGRDVSPRRAFEGARGFSLDRVCSASSLFPRKESGGERKREEEGKRSIRSRSRRFTRKRRRSSSLFRDDAKTRPGRSSRRKAGNTRAIEPLIMYGSHESRESTRTPRLGQISAFPKFFLFPRRSPAARLFKC